MGWGNNSLGDAGYLAPIMQQINRTGDIMQYGDQAGRQNDLLNIQKQKNAFEMQVQGLQMDAAKQAQVEKVRHQNAFSQAYQTADPTKDPEGFARLYVQNGGNPEVAMKLMEDAQKGAYNLKPGEQRFSARGTEIAKNTTPDLSGDVKNFFEINKRMPTQQEWMDMKRAGATNVKVDATTKLTNERENELVKAALKTMPEEQKAAFQSKSAIDRIDQATSILDKQGNKVIGLGGSFRKFIAPYASAVGLNSDTMDDAQILSALLKEGAGGLRAQIIGPGQVSNYEQQIMQDVSGGTMSASDGVKAILSHQRQNHAATIDLYNDKVGAVAEYPGYEGAKRVFKPFEYNKKPNTIAAPIKQAPPAAIDSLRQHPEKAAEFKAKFGYLPEGF